MNEANERDEVEGLLREMSLKVPSPALDRRVAKTMRGAGRVTAWLAVTGGVAAGVAIALIGMRAWPTTKQEGSTPLIIEQSSDAVPLEVPQKVDARTPAIGARAEPVCLQRVYKADTDLGVVGERGNLPVRCIERQTLRNVILYDPENERTIRWTTPERVTVLRTTEPY